MAAHLFVVYVPLQPEPANGDLAVDRAIGDNSDPSLSPSCARPGDGSKDTNPPVQLAADSSATSTGGECPDKAGAGPSPAETAADPLLCEEKASGDERSRAKRFEVVRVETGSDLLDFIPVHSSSLYETLMDTLTVLSVENITCTDTQDGKFQKICFLHDGRSDKVECILEKLMSIGIGQNIPGSSVSVFPATIYVADTSQEEDDESSLEKESEFRRSVKSRLVVAQVVNSVQANAQFNFDYFMFITLASIIAAMGLVENSSVVLVASMLVSPLMGPILAGTFGTMIENATLQNLGLRSELIGLSLCLLWGFIFGLIPAYQVVYGATWGTSMEWPTYEMKSRGMLRSLWVGVCIALPSGAGVALSVLGGNVGSLVGVAISASLLPPAVNSGMLWASALFAAIKSPELKNTTDVHSFCPHYINNEYQPVYSCKMWTELAIMGAVSLLLTVINIICIIVMGIVMLKIKEVAPYEMSTAGTEDFWGKDIKIARDSYKTIKGTASKSIGKEFSEERQKLREMNLGNDYLENLVQAELDSSPVSGPMHRIFTPVLVNNRILFDVEKNSAYATVQYQSKGASERKGSYNTFHSINALRNPHMKLKSLANSPNVHTASGRFQFPSVTDKQRKAGKFSLKKKPNLKLKIPVREKKCTKIIHGKKQKFKITYIPETENETCKPLDEKSREVRF